LISGDGTSRGSTLSLNETQKYQIQLLNLFEFKGRTINHQKASKKKFERDGLNLKNDFVFNQFDCAECFKKYRSKYGLLLHIKCYHLGDSVKNVCSKADQQETSVKSLDTTGKMVYNCESNLDNFECNFCQQKLLSKKYLLQHIQTKHLGVSENVSYPCDKCKKVFKTRKYLGLHRKKNHGCLFLCEICGKNFKCKDYFVQHLHTHSTELRYQCMQCHKKFKVARSLRKHIKSIHQAIRHASDISKKDKEYNTEFTCRFCQKIFQNHSYLHAHETHVHSVRNLEEGNQLYKCETCDKLFKCKKYLKSHLRSKHSNDAKEITCHLCEKTLKHQSYLPTHLLRHMKNSQFECANCDKKYFTEFDLLQHAKNIHHNANYICDFCSSKLANKSVLLTHMYMIHNIGEAVKYECDICHKTYVFKSTLLQHMVDYHVKPKLSDKKKIKECKRKTLSVQNANEKNVVKTYSCNVCGKSFKVEKYLLNHTEKAHGNSNSDENTCNLCRKYFRYKKCLESHKKRALCKAKAFRKSPKVCNTRWGTYKLDNKKVIENQNEFACNICKKVFKNNSLLRQHERCVHSSHSDGKKHTCKVCGKVFKNKRYLNQHENHVHSGQTYTCEFCDIVCKSKIYLQGHIRRIHRKIEKEYCCAICKKIFNRKGSLYAHVRNVHSYTEGVDFTCTTCKKVFKNKVSLYDHFRHVHKKIEKKCTCDICFKVFTETKKLQQHRVNFHKCAMQCRSCKIMFKTRTNFREHYSLMHGSKR
jgi:KRAB domain-containing zinc finger protein